MPKILLAEDDHAIAEMYRIKFELDGFEASVASDGEAALEAIKKEKPDVLLLDMLMPKKSGFDILRELRDKPEFQDIKIIALTNLGDTTTAAQLSKLGVTDYLVKANTTPGEVAEYVREVLNR